MSLLANIINVINENPERKLNELIRSEFNPSITPTEFCLAVECILITWVAYHNNPDAFSGVKVPEIIKDTSDPEMLTMISTAVDFFSEHDWLWFGAYYYDKFSAAYQAYRENADLN